MLVLSRRINETIQIGLDIQVMVIDIRGEVVRLGITAPMTTQIWRKELWDVIVKENRAAAETGVLPIKNIRGKTQTPRLPISTFSRLSKIPTVRPNRPMYNDDDYYRDDDDYDPQRD